MVRTVVTPEDEIKRSVNKFIFEEKLECKFILLQLEINLSKYNVYNISLFLEILETNKIRAALNQCLLGMYVTEG